MYKNIKEKHSKECNKKKKKERGKKPESAIFRVSHTIKWTIEGQNCVSEFTPQ